MKKILVTGGAGNIGSSLVESLLEKDFEVFVFDNFITGNRENLSEENPRLNVVKVDINNKTGTSNIMFDNMDILESKHDYEKVFLLNNGILYNPQKNKDVNSATGFTTFAK